MNVNFSPNQFHDLIEHFDVHDYKLIFLLLREDPYGIQMTSLTKKMTGHQSFANIQAIDILVAFTP